jgi:glycosyltransferase involved in cell wall biosynthesis
VRVSTIIPVFNGAATIADAIESVLLQDFDGERELIVVNDGSTDSTPAIIASFNDRIRVVNQSNRGLAAARNAGAKAASGEFLAFLDADDTWTPDKLARTVGRLETNPSAVLAYSDIFAIRDNGHSDASPITPALAHAPSISELLERWWPILPSTVVMRHEAFMRTGGFCEQFRRAYEDVDMWLQARELGEFEFVPSPLVRYRTTPEMERMERYEADYPVFRSRVRARYGRRCRKLLRATQEAYVASLGHRGLIAMQAGDTTSARRLFLRALAHQPRDPRTILRLARSLLPRRISRTLAGRTIKLERS